MYEFVEFIRFLFVVRTRSPALIKAQKEYYEKNKEKHTAYVREWRSKKKIQN